MSKQRTENNIPKCAEVVVSGRVQGVGFRYFTQTMAIRYTLVGWVRNNYNGTVTIWVEGQEENINNFMKSIQQGPSGAYVKKVDIQWHSPFGKYDSFNIRT